MMRPSTHSVMARGTSTSRPVRNTDLSVVFFVVIGFARNPRGRCLARRGRHPFGQQDRLCTAYVLLALPDVGPAVEPAVDPALDPVEDPEADALFDPPAGFDDAAAAPSDEPDLPPSDDAPALLPSPSLPDAFEPLLAPLSAPLLDPLDPLPPRKSVTYQPEPFS